MPTSPTTWSNLTPPQITGLRTRPKLGTPKILQINVPDANIVDRCESCHMGIREPVKLTAGRNVAEGQETRPIRAGVHQPSRTELLKTHDPEKFGCSPCHQGNGRATTSVEKAHGTYEHWLWPLFPRGNMEAGCQTCHAADMVLVDERRRLDAQRRQRPLPSTRLRGLSSLRGL